jgi:cyclopropane-fatty-acyl-phospholipid synthase
MSAAQKILASLDDKKAGELFYELLAAAGVTVNGPEPWDIQVHDDRLFVRCLREGTLGFGEAYVDGWWDAPAMDQLLTRLVRARIDNHIRDNWVTIAAVVRARIFNLQAVARAFEVAERHYDLGNDLYERMLDERMMYTCAYWSDARDLDAAQEAKLDLICRKLGLAPGARVLELGCGWGGFASFAAERYGARVVGLTVSKEQVAWARERYAHLRDKVDIRLDDYRNATGQYDAVVSIGLMEHVGPKNHRGYMELVARCLAPGGVAFVHSIGNNRTRGQIDPFFHKYIFPNAVLPSLTQISAAAEELFTIEDVHNLGPHYDRTLMAWQARFDDAWPLLRAKYGEPFRRMWTYYLMTSAALFRARYLQLFQLVLTREGTPQPDCRKS